METYVGRMMPCMELGEEDTLMLVLEIPLSEARGARQGETHKGIQAEEGTAQVPQVSNGEPTASQQGTKWKGAASIPASDDHDPTDRQERQRRRSADFCHGCYLLTGCQAGARIGEGQS